MIAKSVIACSVYLTIALAQDTFEPLNFNVTEALIANGVNVSALPELSAIAEKRSISDPCSVTCGSLKALFTDKTITGGPAYDAFKTTFWSKQAAQVDPSCIFKPTSALDVSIAVLLSRLTQCPFAVKGGGHTAFAGAASIQDGLTISLEAMNEITLSSDKKTASIGPGNRWGAVYEKLGKQNLAVTGGRASEVGMGLILGGGISHHSNIHGLGCDNVASFELVTASGAILKVSPTQFPDLYWGLRGGGNNFGIVTKFNLETIQQGLMWGGNRVHLPPQYPALVNAFATMAENAARDPKAVQLLSFANTAGTAAASLQIEYLQPVNEANPPEILKEYLSIPSIAGSTFNRTLANDTGLLTSQMPGGHRYAFSASTFKIDRDFMMWMQELYTKDVSTLADQTALNMQAFTVPALQQMSKKGGNALGLSPADGPLFHVLLYMVWEDAAKDDMLNKAAQTFLNTAKEEAKARGLYNRFIYLNYAGPYQNVIPGYGEKNLARLKAIANKYDPKRILQMLQPGGFKLEGAPFGLLS